jgi:hypothetical protein
LFADIDSLTEEARSALINEIRRRRLSEPQLEKLHSTELRHEAQFDRLERFRRRKMLVKDLGLDPKGWIIGIIGASLLLLIEKLISNHH